MKDKNLKRLKKILQHELCSDELDDTLFYLNEYERLSEFKEAYYSLLDATWEVLSKDGQKETNKMLNKIFKINKNEQVKN